MADDAPRYAAMVVPYLSPSGAFRNCPGTAQGLWSLRIPLHTLAVAADCNGDTARMQPGLVGRPEFDIWHLLGGLPLTGSP
jgi:hypothetical protein